VGGGAFEPDQRDADDLLKLAVSRPHDALAQARELLAGRPTPYVASIAHQAAGIVLRDTGDVQAALAELRKALRAATMAGLTERAAEVMASLGAALVHANRTAEGLAALDRAVGSSSVAQLGRTLHLRGSVLWVLGRNSPALEDLRRAVSLLERDGDRAWMARALNSRGCVYLDLGLPAQADADFAAAERLYSQTSQDLESILAVINRAAAAFRSGDLPGALSLLDEAAARYHPLRVPTPWLSRLRCDVLLVAGLSSEALTEAEAAIAAIERVGSHAGLKADLVLTAANCALAANRPEVALQHAHAARRLFRLQQRELWSAHADLALVQAKFARGPLTAHLLLAANRAAERLEELGPRESTQAHLLAGRVALALGRLDRAADHLTVAADSRKRGLATDRISGWLSEALRAEAAADSARMLTACRRGLAVLDEHRLTLGATELRARSTAQGAELAALAQRRAAQQHQPRNLLAWSERWRSTALAVPPVRLAAGTGFTTDLAALRQATSRLAEARREGRPTSGLEREQLRLERAVRSRSLQTKGTAGSGHPVVDVAQLLAALGSVQVVEMVEVDGSLHVLIAAAGRVRQFEAGRTADVSRAADFARFALRRLARNRSPDDVAGASAILDRAGLELERAAIGPAAAALREGPVVIVPPGRLHGIPWGLLPMLSNRVFSVAPSAGAWLRAQDLRPPSRRHVVLAQGPGLATEGAEVPLVASLHADAIVLSGAEATAERLLSELDGAWLGHVAAHGTFRADSPLFSALRMHDGPLTVYDFEQLHRAPYWLVLSSCDVGQLAPTGADELLGLVASLLPLGTAGVVASVVPLNDHAAVPVMVTLHRNLHAGRSLAESLRMVREENTGDPVRRGVAASLLAYGTC
jgi:predicted negative regulator of RcsB-dependent stress response